MTKLNQLIAIEKGAKSQANDAITGAYHQIQKPDLFGGISRVYSPLDEEGEQFPPESTKVQLRADDLLRTAADAWTRLLDVTATKDASNAQAKADVKVGDQVIVSQAPVTFLIWFEKQLVDMRTLVSKLPTLDPAMDWEENAAAAAWSTPTVQTHKTKKVLRNHVKAAATAQHAEQVEVYTEDVIVGYWNTVRFSGAIPQTRVNQLVERVEELQRAVKFAREEANSIAVTDVSVGGQLFDYLLS